MDSGQCGKILKNIDQKFSKKKKKIMFLVLTFLHDNNFQKNNSNLMNALIIELWQG